MFWPALPRLRMPRILLTHNHNNSNVNSTSPSFRSISGHILSALPHSFWYHTIQHHNARSFPLSHPLEYGLRAMCYPNVQDPLQISHAMSRSILRTRSPSSPQWWSARCALLPTSEPLPSSLPILAANGYPLWALAGLQPVGLWQPFRRLAPRVVDLSKN